MKNNVIHGRFHNRITNRITNNAKLLDPIDLTKALSKQPIRPRSYEDVVHMKIELAKWRADGYQASGDFESAALEISYLDGLKWALKEYKQWCLN